MHDEVELLIDGNNPKAEPMNGLALWNILNRHSENRKDRLAIMQGTGPTDLHGVKFAVDRMIDWMDVRSTFVPRMKYAARLEGIPHLPELLPHQGRMAIVGAAPSVSDHIDQIKKFKLSDQDNLMSVNAAHDWLIKRGIIPRIHVIAEFDFDDIEKSLGGPPHPEVTYYMSSITDMRVMRQLTNYRRVIWHHFMPMQGYQNAITRYFKNEFMICSGVTPFFKSIAIAATLGFRSFDLFGCDSSFDESSHVDGYVMANKEPKIKIWSAHPDGTNLREFTTQGGLAFQAKEFLEFCRYNQSGISLRVHGDGLLRHLHASRYPEQYQPKE